MDMDAPSLLEKNWGGRKSCIIFYESWGKERLRGEIRQCMHAMGTLSRCHVVPLWIRWRISLLYSLIFADITRREATVDGVEYAWVWVYPILS